VWEEWKKAHLNLGMAGMEEGKTIPATLEVWQEWKKVNPFLPVSPLAVGGGPTIGFSFGLSKNTGSSTIGAHSRSAAGDYSQPHLHCTV
jgi:hypothetical protein